MHHPLLFRWFHRRHHRSVVPTPWTAYAFDAPEALVQALFLPLFLAAVPMHGLAILLFLVHMIVRNVLGHSGYELLPRSLAHSRAWGWSNGVTHHDLHHETFRWNYGFYFTWWDRLMGTEHPQYRERLSGTREVPALLLALLLVPAEPATAGALDGEWATQGYSARVRIGPCDDEHRRVGRIALARLRARQHGAARRADRLGGQDDRLLRFRKTAGSFAAGIASCSVRD